jgi:ssDNA-binding Zn-finger/Zn-ribbon topoisomerase 1
MVLRHTPKFGGRLFWGCSRWPTCSGIHGAHPDGRPLGIPADAETKRARIAAHAAFDRLWRGGQMSRGEAYRWLQTALGMTKEEAHIGRFDAATCARVVAAVGEHLGGGEQRCET